MSGPKTRQVAHRCVHRGRPTISNQFYWNTATLVTLHAVSTSGDPGLARKASNIYYLALQRRVWSLLQPLLLWPAIASDLDVSFCVCVHGNQTARAHAQAARSMNTACVAREEHTARHGLAHGSPNICVLHSHLTGALARGALPPCSTVSVPQIRPLFPLHENPGTT